MVSGFEEQRSFLNFYFFLKKCFDLKTKIPFAFWKMFRKNFCSLSFFDMLSEHEISSSFSFVGALVSNKSCFCFSSFCVVLFFENKSLLVKAFS